MKFPEVLDNTIVTSFAACERRFFWTHLMHLAPKGVRVHLDAGKCYAKALETTRLAFWDPQSPTYRKPKESILAGFRNLIQSWGYDEQSDVVFANTKKEFHRVAEMFIRHFDHFGLATDKVKPAFLDGKPAVERSFTLELDIKHPDTGDNILYHGRYDMLAEYSGGLWIFDDKTCSQLGATWANQWDHRTQFTGYIYGAKAHNIPVLGAIVRGACFYVQSVDFAQSITRRQQWQLDQWWEDLHQTVFQMVAYYERARNEKKEGQNPVDMFRLYPARGMFNEHCKSYGGCEMQSLCATAHPQRWLRDYSTRIWDPRNPDKDGEPQI
ncbi:MAG: PD-(D/E)XK nuclease superfamily protein [Siphoviridae sp. ct7UA22]|nr:MAG: PD-(D/E)XK nuclease superfamily protein [Siphoviridae sp. ct7UA22]